MKRGIKLLLIAVAITIGHTQCGNTSGKLTPEGFLSEIQDMADSMKYYSGKWNARAAEVLRENKEFERLIPEREQFEAYIARAGKEMKAMDEPGKNAKDVKVQFARFMETNDKLLKDISPQIENLGNEISDSLQSKKSMIGYNALKYNSDLEDAFMKVLNYIQLYQMNNNLNQKK